MRIAVMGAGAVGGYFGARLRAAGADVAFLARGRHLAAIRSDGLRIDSATGNLHLRNVTVSDDPAALGPADIVLFAVKLWDTETAAAALAPLIGPETAVITLQNGVTSAQTLIGAVGAPHVAGGVAHIAAQVVGPGLIRHTGNLARLSFGELNGKRSERMSRFHTLASAAGFDAIYSPDILSMIWEKFTFLAPFSGVTALTRQPVGVIRAVPETRALFLDAVAEVAELARRHAVNLGPDIVERIATLIDSLVPEMKSSMLNDLERGGRLELPWLSGAVDRLGHELGVPTPVHRAITAALAPYVNGSPAK